jgi:hypothetical protein
MAFERNGPANRRAVAFHHSAEKSWILSQDGEWLGRQ